jgi:hypothetical protein
MLYATGPGQCRLQGLAAVGEELPERLVSLTPHAATILTDMFKFVINLQHAASEILGRRT